MKKIILSILALFWISLPAYAANFALQFDGSNDYATANDSAMFNFYGNDFTLESYIRLSEYRYANTIYSKYDGLNVNPSGWIFDIGMEGGTFISFIEFVGNGTRSWSQSYDFDLNIWYHVAVVRSGNSMKFFINGAQIDGDKDCTGYVIKPLSGHPLRFGNYESSPNFFSGYIDEPRVWDYGRTEEEIQDNMDSSLTGSEEGLIAYWNFNEGGGSTFRDLTNNGHDGYVSSVSDTGNEPSWAVSDSPVQSIVPEPASLLLFGLGGGILALVKRKR